MSAENSNDNPGKDTKDNAPSEGSEKQAIPANSAPATGQDSASPAGMPVQNNAPEGAKPAAENEKYTINIAAKDHWRKGNSFFEEGNYLEALKEYSTAIEIDNKYADAYFNRALTERILQNYESAKKDINILIELQPESPDGPLLMGDIAESNEDFITARYWYEKALQINPDYAEARNRLEHLDMLIHIKSMPTDHKDDAVGSQQSDNSALLQQNDLQGMGSSKDVVSEGQIKKLSFYKSNRKFDSVIGLQKVKKYLTENVVLAIKEPQLFKKYGKKLGLGLILYGPPGVGKTHIVNAVAGEAGANVIIARLNQIVDMYTGNTEKNLHAIFEQARQNTPCIILFDEIDALGMKRGGGSEQGEGSSVRLAINQFLTEMDGIEKNPEGIFVIGTTNQPWDIDPALKRSGRFGDRIYLRAPTYKERRELFRFYLSNIPKGNINYGRLARATIGYSPADIANICDKSAMKPLLHEYINKKERKLETKDIIDVLKDKDLGGSSLDEWYEMVKKDVISKTETQIVDGKKQQIVKEGKLDAEEKVLYKSMIRDIKRNTGSMHKVLRKLMRFWALYLF
ncbi:MAG: ATP-binding protein [Candidatus Micrarchaeia archaeon]